MLDVPALETEVPVVPIISLWLPILLSAGGETAHWFRLRRPPGSATEAVARQPDDTISRGVLNAVEKVRAGQAPPPKSMAEVRRLAR